MKPILITAAILAAAGIAILQHSKLSDLKAETARLETGKTPSAMKRTDRSPPATEIRQATTPEQIELVRESMVEAFLAFQNRSGGRDPDREERMKKLLLAAKDLSARDVETVMTGLQADSRLADIGRDKILRACADLFGGIIPFSWREYLTAHRDLPDWQQLFESACWNCLREDDKRALALIEQETAHGNPEVATSNVRSGVLMALATSDPDKMLAMAASPELAAVPDALFNLGAFAASKIDNVADQQRFLTALRRAQEKNPSPVIDKIRNDYVSGIGQRLYDWPPADAISLIDSGLTPDERFSTAATLANRGDLSDPGKWVDWFLRIDPKEWTEWAKRKGIRETHPLVTQIESRANQDYQVAGEWLAKIPPGALRDEATLGFAWAIAARDPDRAAGYLGELPESKGKQNLVKKIAEAKR